MYAVCIVTCRMTEPLSPLVRRYFEVMQELALLVSQANCDKELNERITRFRDLPILSLRHTQAKPMCWKSDCVDTNVLHTSVPTCIETPVLHTADPTCVPQTADPTCVPQMVDPTCVSHTADPTCVNTNVSHTADPACVTHTSDPTCVESCVPRSAHIGLFLLRSVIHKYVSRTYLAIVLHSRRLHVVQWVQVFGDLHEPTSEG